MIDFCDCFKDEEFSEVKEIYKNVCVGRLSNPNAYGYPEICYIPLDLELKYCPKCGKKLKHLEVKE